MAMASTTTTAFQHKPNECLPELARLQMRCDELAAKFYQARADYEQAKAHSTLLTSTLRAKQEVIERLLAFYPHPITPELQRKIDLT